MKDTKEELITARAEWEVKAEARLQEILAGTSAYEVVRAVDAAEAEFAKADRNWVKRTAYIKHVLEIACSGVVDALEEVAPDLGHRMSGRPDKEDEVEVFRATVQIAAAMIARGYEDRD